MSDADLHHPLWSSLGGLVRFYGRVDYLTSLAKMREADLLLLIDAPAENGAASVFFPLKLAEYLGSGRPIIGFTPASGASARILRETGGFVVDLGDTAGLADLLVGIADGRVSLKADPIPRAKYDYRHVGRQLADILERTRRGG
jgi:glycosyltransferase involved in cell wall biosynthesis